MTLVPGINLEGVIDQNINLDIEEQDMKKELKLKKGKKINFDKLFPAPKDNESMGLDNIYNGEPFEGLL